MKSRNKPNKTTKELKKLRKEVKEFKAMLKLFGQCFIDQNPNEPPKIGF